MVTEFRFTDKIWLGGVFVVVVVCGLKWDIDIHMRVNVRRIWFNTYFKQRACVTNIFLFVWPDSISSTSSSSSTSTSLLLFFGLFLLLFILWYRSWTYMVDSFSCSVCIFSLNHYFLLSKLVNCVFFFLPQLSSLSHSLFFPFLSVDVCKILFILYLTDWNCLILYCKRNLKWNAITVAMTATSNQINHQNTDNKWMAFVSFCTR